MDAMGLEKNTQLYQITSLTAEKYLMFSCSNSYPGKETTSPNDRTLPQPVLEPNHAQSIPKRPVFLQVKGW